MKLFQQQQASRSMCKRVSIMTMCDLQVIKPLNTEPDLQEYWVQGWRAQGAESSSRSQKPPGSPQPHLIPSSHNLQGEKKVEKAE